MTTPSETPETPAPTPSAGWYPDPALTAPGQLGERYWDGSGWTPQVRAVQVAPNPSTLTVSPTGAPYAQWWQRGLGYLIDYLLFLPFYIALAFVAVANMLNSERWDYLVSSSSNSNDAEIMQMMVDALLPLLPFYLILLALTYAYWVICLGRWGRTLGGYALGIKAVDSDGAIPSYSAAAKRYLLIFGLTLGQGFAQFVPFLGGLLGTAVFGLFVVCFFSMLWNSSRQSWQDRFAGTYVIQTRNQK